MFHQVHYTDVIMSAIASQIAILTSVYSTVYSCADHRKHQSSASLAFVGEIYQGPVNSPHKGPVTRKMFPFDDVIMQCATPMLWGPRLHISILELKLIHVSKRESRSTGLAYVSKISINDIWETPVIVWKFHLKDWSKFKLMLKYSEYVKYQIYLLKHIW